MLCGRDRWGETTVAMEESKRVEGAGDGDMSMATRMTRQFSWEEVDDIVIRAMLEVAHRENNQGDLLVDVRRLNGSELRKSAMSVFGRPPAQKYFTKPMTKTLIKVWLPLADDETVKEVTTAVQIRLGGAEVDRQFRSSSGRVKFLRERRVTTNLQTNVRKAFLRAHKIPDEVPLKIHGPLGDPATPIMLDGEGYVSLRPVHAHHFEAWAALDELIAGPDRVCGRIVLPTGAGKTDTAAMWLLHQMAADPELRVLWISHQQELIGQALARFQNLARQLPAGVHREARRIHTGGAAPSTLASDDLAVAGITIQSLVRVPTRSGNPLDRFLKHPTMVVIDEAHHAGSPSYEEVFDRLAKHPTVKAIIGLTATPYPTSAVAHNAFLRHFPVEIVTRESAPLVERGILARLRLQIVDTGKAMLLDSVQRKAAVANDLTYDVLREVGDDELRNELVVRTWMSRSEQWGKTLVFATSIDHAEALTALFCGEGASAKALHSRSEGSREGILQWFRDLRSPGLLVSVGMLTEGVDLPDARTALLARPTTSRILMQQMIGRVLRGPAAGGEAEANVVYLRDQWRNFGDVLEPGEVVERVVRDVRDPDGTLRPLPPLIFDDHGEDIPGDAAYQVERQLDASRQSADLDDLDDGNDRSIDPHLAVSSLCGYYRLPDRTVPVFEHQRESYERLLAECEYRMNGRAFLGYFAELAPPYPTRRTLRDLADWTCAHGEPPAFVELDAHIGPRIGTDRVLFAGAVSDAERAAVIRDVYENSIARHVYPSFEHFEEAVDAELRERRAARRRFQPEQPLHESPSGAQPLPRSDRSLEPATELALETAARILPLEHTVRLERLPVPRWTTHVNKATFGHASLTLTGKAAGRQIIRINSLLRTDEPTVTDEMVGYLIYHEMLHHLLPGQSHDAEFRRLEALWPNAVYLELSFATLHETWDTRPESYR